MFDIHVLPLQYQDLIFTISHAIYFQLQHQNIMSSTCKQISNGYMLWLYATVLDNKMLGACCHSRVIYILKCPANT